MMITIEKIIDILCIISTFILIALSVTIFILTLIYKRILNWRNKNVQ